MTRRPWIAAAAVVVAVLAGVAQHPGPDPSTATIAVTGVQIDGDVISFAYRSCLIEGTYRNGEMTDLHINQRVHGPAIERLDQHGPQAQQTRFQTLTELDEAVDLNRQCQ